MPGAHTTAHLRRDRSTSHSVFFFFARCSERGERPHQPAAPNEEGSRAARRKKSTPHPVFTSAIRRSERGERPRQPAGKGPPQPESYPPSPSAIPNAQGRGGTTPSASPGPSANPANPAPSTPPRPLIIKKEPRPATLPHPPFSRSPDQQRPHARPSSPQPHIPASPHFATFPSAPNHPQFSSRPPQDPRPELPLRPHRSPPLRLPRSFSRSSVPLPAIAPAGIGVAQTGIPVIPRSAQSAIFAPSDPSPDIRIPWQTSSNA